MAVLRRVNGVNRLEYPIGTVLADQIAWPLWMVRVSPDGERVAYATRTNGTAIGLTVVDRARKTDVRGRRCPARTPPAKCVALLEPEGDRDMVSLLRPQRAGHCLRGRYEGPAARGVAACHRG